MSHPWSNLTEAEISEMVEFCRKYFSLDEGEKRCLEGHVGDNIQGSCHVCRHPYSTVIKPKWEWKKGDWGFDDGVAIDDPMRVCLITTSDCGHYDPDRDIVPLPLAHQWMVRDEWQENMNLIPPWTGPSKEKFPWFYVKSDSHKIFSQHENPHFVCCRAIKKVIENRPSPKPPIEREGD